MRPVPLPALLLAAVAIAQEPTCRLEGQVVDPMQQPVANAEVTATLDGDQLAQTRTDGSGAFVFARLPCRAVCVVARADGPDVGAAWLDLLGLQIQFTRITTMPARAVHGVVRDENGVVVPRAWVVSAPLGDEVIAVAATMVQADANGAFTLTHVPFGKNLVRAWAPDHDASEDRIDGAEDLQVECTLTTGAKLERSFLFEPANGLDSPRARLEVAATHRNFPMPLPPPLHRPAAQDGGWRLGGWPLDRVTARVVIDGGSALPPVCVVPADRSGSTQRFHGAAGDEHVIHGHLHGMPDGDGVWLVAEPMGEGRRVFTRCQPDGSFTLPAPVTANGEFAIRVLESGLAVQPGEADSQSVWWTGTWQPGQPIDVTVRTAMRVRLCVRAADGAGEPGATVRLFAVADADLPTDTDAPELEPETAIACGTTGFDGRLELGGLVIPHTAQVQCVVQSRAGRAVRSFATNADAVCDLGAMVPDGGATAEFVAMDEHDAAVAGACLSLQMFALHEQLPRQIVCDRHGRARQQGMPASACVIHSGDDCQFFTPVPGDVTTIELRATNRR